MSNVLEAKDISVAFGGLLAVNSVDFNIPKKSVVSLIGPNGAGKTTFFNVLTGLYKPSAGSVEFQGKNITDLPPHKIASIGIARTFQNIRLFGLMTAQENLMVAMHTHLKSGILSTILRTPKQRKEEREAEERAQEILDFVELESGPTSLREIFLRRPTTSRGCSRISFKARNFVAR